MKDNPLYLHELIDIGVDTVTLDPNLPASATCATSASASGTSTR